MHLNEQLTRGLATRRELLLAARHYSRQPNAKGLAKAYARAAKVQKRGLRKVFCQVFGSAVREAYNPHTREVT